MMGAACGDSLGEIWGTLFFVFSLVTMTGSWIYGSASIYEAAMRFLYGRWYNERYRSLAELIGEGSSVTDGSTAAIPEPEMTAPSSSSDL